MVWKRLVMHLNTVEIHSKQLSYGRAVGVFLLKTNPAGIMVYLQNIDRLFLSRHFVCNRTRPVMGSVNTRTCYMVGSVFLHDNRTQLQRLLLFVLNSVSDQAAPYPRLAFYVNSM